MYADILSDFTSTVFCQFLLFQQPGELSRNNGSGKAFFLPQKVRTGSGAQPAS
jgi:hypothetical protein